MVLILYVESGAGSLTLARNVQHALNEQSIENKIISLHELLPVWVNKLLFSHYENWCVENKGYFKAIFKSPWFYPVLYRLLPLIMRCKGVGQDKDVPHQLQSADAIVSCSFFCGWFSRYWLNKSGRTIPLYGVLGDYAVSPGWRLHIDMLFVPYSFNSPVFKAICRKGGKLMVSGIPAYLRPSNAPEEKGCVMLSGGGWGLQINTDTVEALLALPVLHRLIVLCGTNTPLYEAMCARFVEPIKLKRLEVHSWTRDISNLYARAEAVITKAGGLTLTEAALSGKPLIINGYLPGHEEENMRVFLRNNAALYAQDDQALVSTVSAVLTNKLLTCELKRQAATLVNDQAGNVICEQIKKDLNYVDA